MTYESEREEMNREEKPAVSLSLGFAAEQVEQRYLRELAQADPEEKEQLLRNLTDFLNRFLSQPTVSGSADEWHNMAVDLVVRGEGMYSLACQVLDCGLRYYPKNVDLLADYLQYGTKCGRNEQCKVFRDRLVSIPKPLWSWRGYRFLIEYCKNQMAEAGSDEELERYKAEIETLLKQYRQQFPDDEDSYDCEADFCKALNNHRREEAILRKALKTLKLAPKCAMQLAGILFDRGDYQEALDMTQRALRDAVQTQMSVNEAYLSYLSGLTKMALLLIHEEEEGCPEEKVLSIYCDFETALRQSLDANYRRVLKQRAIRLKTKTGIEVPSAYEELNYLVS